jgi:hypothetical protein
LHPLKKGVIVGFLATKSDFNTRPSSRARTSLEAKTLIYQGFLASAPHFLGFAGGDLTPSD